MTAQHAQHTCVASLPGSSQSSPIKPVKSIASSLHKYRNICCACVRQHAICHVTRCIDRDNLHGMAQGLLLREDFDNSLPICSHMRTIWRWLGICFQAFSVRPQAPDDGQPQEEVFAMASPIGPFGLFRCFGSWLCGLHSRLVLLAGSTSGLVLFWPYVIH